MSNNNEEDSTDNYIFVALRTRFKNLLAEVENKGLIVVLQLRKKNEPNQLKAQQVKEEEVKACIFVASPEDPLLLYSLLYVPSSSSSSSSLHKLQLRPDRQSCLKGGIEMPIAYEEKFYSERTGKSFTIIALSQPSHQSIPSSANTNNIITQQMTPGDGIMGLAEAKAIVFGGRTSFDEMKKNLWTKIIATGGEVSKDLDPYSRAGRLTTQHLTIQSRKILQSFNKAAVEMNIAPPSASVYQPAISCLLLAHLHSSLFPALAAQHAPDDCYLHELMKNGQDIKAKQVGVSMEGWDDWAYEAIAKVQLVEEGRTPGDKLRALCSALNLLNKEAQINHIALATDDLLPLVIFILLKSMINHLYTNIVYTSDFLSTIDMSTSEAGFTLATFQAAVEYMRNDEGFKNLICSTTKRKSIPSHTTSSFQQQPQQQQPQPQKKNSFKSNTPLTTMNWTNKSNPSFTKSTAVTLTPMPSLPVGYSSQKPPEVISLDAPTESDLGDFLSQLQKGPFMTSSSNSFSQ